MEKLQCKLCDIHLKIPNSLKKLNIRDLKVDTDPSISYIQGRVKERSELQKNKWFDYMRVSLQDDQDDTSCQIMVFVTGSIAKEMDIIQKDYTLVLSGFKVEENSRIKPSSHPCQLVVDEEMSTPKVWYIEPEPDLIDSQEPSTSVAVNGQRSRVNTPDRQPSDNAKTKKADSSKKVYSYCRLSSLKPNTVVDVYGVVKFFKSPSKTRGSDYSMLVTLVDPSLCELDANKKLKCLLFHRDQAQLPSVDVGDIIRFHRLKVSLYNGDLQGQNGPGFSWLCVSGVAGDPIEPKASSNNFSFTERDTEKIEELRCWQEKDQVQWSQEERTRNKHIEDIVPGLYLDLLCQVISVQVVDDSCVTFRVWDGTKTIYMVREMEADPNTHIRRTDRQLNARAKDWAVDVALYDDHSITAANIQPGQFIKLCNLHAAVLKTSVARDNMSSLPTLELVLHRGTSYGRGLNVMKAESPDILTLIDTLDRVAPPIGDDFDEAEAMDLFEGSMKEPEMNGDDIGEPSIQENTINSSTQHNINNRKRPADNENDCQSDSARKRTRSSFRGGNITQNCDQSAVSDITSDQSALELSCDSSHNQSASPDYVERCMLQTETVVLNHPHVQVTSIQDIESHSVPYKFRVLGRIEEYFPCPVQAPEDLVRLYCSQCNCLVSLPKVDGNSNEEPSSSTSQVPEVSHVQAGVQYYKCPTCKTVDLIYTYMLRLLIRDSTGWIQANLWREEAVTFFKDIDPRDVVSSQKIFRDVCDQLDKISVPVNGKKPLVECGVMSFSSGKGTGYHIFDTCVA
ncbi:protection of telomeres protein 1-like [Pecten maximus]|uniref:protection of telomeres protein 1-like n=1 Tax=Pecten maximus TaxID=6579 RepID=UPI001458EC6B|nr:protection of telomeres protein 1-like [Pecten maximus]XP_033744931.1 protection of telomeres protein 1-like [Pecten maximus]XP_033744933.1 protection of telomeres protein 1-like [Pecten maximus]